MNKEYLRRIIVSLANKHMAPKPEWSKGRTEKYLKKIEQEVHILTQLLAGISDKQIADIFKEV